MSAACRSTTLISDPAARLFVALDVETLAEAEALLDRLGAETPGVKIGNQLFTAAGPTAVERAHKRGARVFLDLKYHDIPNTVAGAVREATRLGVFMLNVHASGGVAMMRAAAEAATKAASDSGVPRPIVLGVTVLTSLDRKALLHDLGVAATVESHVLRLAERAREAGLDGCVASPREIGLLRGALGPGWKIVTPGVRPAPLGSEAAARVAGAGPSGSEAAARVAGAGPSGSEAATQMGGAGPSGSEAATRMGGAGGPGEAPRPKDDQVRVATPTQAIRAGADYLVVGRPITAAPDPAAAIRAIRDEIRSA